jgi:transposase
MLIGGMPPKAHLEPHLTLEDLKVRYRQTRDTTEARRWHVLYLVGKGWTIKQAAEVVGLNYDYAKEIIRRYNREGPSSIKNRNRERQPPMAKSLLTPQQQQELLEALQGPAPDGGSWSGPKVAEWIAHKTGRRHVWPQRGWDYLKRLGVELKHPTTTDDFQ